MGLLDTILGDTPERRQMMGLLSGGLMMGNGRAGLLNANQYAAGAGDRRQKAELEALRMQAQQMELAQRQMEMDKARQEQESSLGMKALQAQFFNQGSPGLGGTGAVNGALPPELQIGAQSPIPAKPPSFDVNGFANAALSKGYVDPLAAIKLRQSMAPPSQINKLDVKDFDPASVAKFNQTGNYADLVRMDKLHFGDTGGALVGLNAFTGKPVGSVPKTGNPFSDLVVSDGQGGMRENSPLIGAKSRVAAAGASRTNVSVNTEKNLLNEVASGLGKSVTDGQTGAKAALSTISTVSRLNDALDSGKVMAGPGTTFRQYGLQVGSMLGVGGADAKETLTNTRAAIQSLAQLELDGAQQMKGQGQITEAERSIIKRAASGDVDSMTVPELRVLSGVLDRSARTKIRSYNAQVAPLKSNPNAAPLVPFLDVAEPPERKQATPNVLRFDAQGNPVR